MANETARVRTIAMDSKSENRGLSGKTGAFKSSVPAGAVRPKSAPVPQTTK